MGTAAKQARVQAIYLTSFVETIDIPVLSGFGLAVLIVGLALAGLWGLRSSARRVVSPSFVRRPGISTTT